MCLEVVVLFPRGSKRSLDPVKIGSASGLHVAASRTDDGREVFYLSGNGECACDLLASPGRSGQEWKLAPDQLPRVAAALEAVGRKASGFSFRAEWLGVDGRLGSRQEVSFSQLISHVRMNQLQNGVEYVVAG